MKKQFTRQSQLGKAFWTFVNQLPEFTHMRDLKDLVRIGNPILKEWGASFSWQKNILYAGMDEEIGWEYLHFLDFTTEQDELYFVMRWLYIES